MKISSFEISGDVQWDLIERDLLQKGVVLEHEISKKLNEMYIAHDLNCTFIYLSGRRKFMIDYNLTVMKNKKS